MEQTIEIMLDQLATNEQFLRTFEEGSTRTRRWAPLRNVALTPFEVRALLSTDADLFESLAQELDARLKKDSLQS